MPVIFPAESTDNPAGNVGVAVNVNGDVPPNVLIGLNDVATDNCVNTLSEFAVFTVDDKAPPAPSTNKSNDAVAVFPPTSVNVTVYVVDTLFPAVGMPEILTAV